MILRSLKSETFKKNKKYAYDELTEKCKYHMRGMLEPEGRHHSKKENWRYGKKNILFSVKTRVNFYIEKEICHLPC